MPAKKEETKKPSRTRKSRKDVLPEIHAHLKILFSPKQKELVLKRLRAGKFTKTEREYYSRVVKKKLSAMASKEIHKIATTLAEN